MKYLHCSLIFVCLAVVLSLLLGYTVYAVAEGDEYDSLAGIISSLCFMSMLVPFVGISHNSVGINTNLKMLSVVFLVLSLISQFCFASFGVKLPYYLIVNGLLVVLYGIIYLKIAQVKNV